MISSPFYGVLLTVLTVIVASTAPASAETPVPVSLLGSHTHIHGLAVDRQDSAYLLIATHHGLFRAGPDGNAQRISVVQDFMGFNAHPSDPARLFASGHPAGGGNLGFIASTDGGVTWEQVTPGANGPVDFHQMSVSPADPQRIYGAYGGLQTSDDGGKTWAVVGALPDGLIDLAASAKNVDTLYAATETGLLVSMDRGGKWETILQGSTVAMVDVAPDGTLYAFVLGRGLLRSVEDTLEFETVSDDWGERFVLHLAIDPAAPDRMFAATQDGAVLASTNRGATWAAFGD